MTDWKMLFDSQVRLAEGLRVEQIVLMAKLREAIQLIENLAGALKNIVCRHSWMHEDSSCNCDEYFQAKKTLDEFLEWKGAQG